MILIIILVVVLLIVIWCISTVNGFKKKEIRVQEGLSGVEVALTKRYNMLTKMLDTAKGYMAHENELFAKIIELRGRSSFQSPAYLSICMIAAAMGGRPFGYPAGVFVHNDRFKHILMAMETEITKDGISYKNVQGTAEENKALADSYGHLCKLRDEVISMGIIPPVEKWRGLNPHLK